jgi:hypothetical protein
VYLLDESGEHLQAALWLAEPLVEERKLKAPILEGLALFHKEYGTSVNMMAFRQKLAKTSVTVLEKAMSRAVSSGSQADEVRTECIKIWNKGKRAEARLAA